MANYNVEDRTLVGEKLIANPEGMREKADQLSKLIQQLNGKVEELKAAMDACEQTWEGQGADEYAKRFHDTYSALKVTVNKFKDFTVLIYNQAYEFEKRDKKAIDAAEYAKQMVDRLTADMFQSS